MSRVSSPNAAAASRSAVATASAESSGRSHDVHALAATAGGRLDQHRVGVVGHGVEVELRGDRHAGALGDLARPVLAGHRSDGVGDGPIQVRPASTTARANSAFSDRNP